jgi:hypothetical protein
VRLVRLEEGAALVSVSIADADDVEALVAPAPAQDATSEVAPEAADVTAPAADQG